MNKPKLILQIYSKLINSNVRGSLKVLGYFFLLGALIFHQEISYILLHSNLIHDTIQQNKEVRRELKKLNTQYNSSYVAINLFGNGTKSLSNIHYAKMSRKWEAKAHDTLKVLTYKLQNFSIDPFLDEFDALEENRYYYVNDIDKHSNQYFKDQVSYYGFKSVLYVAIFDKTWWFGENQFIGFMSYEYFHTTDFNKNEISAMTKQVDNKVKYLIR